MQADPEFEALADDLGAMASAREAQTAVIVLIGADGSVEANGFGCTCDACLGKVMRIIAEGFGPGDEAEGTCGDCHPAEAVH